MFSVFSKHFLLLILPDDTYSGKTGSIANGFVVHNDFYFYFVLSFISVLMEDDDDDEHHVCCCGCVHNGVVDLRFSLCDFFFSPPVRDYNYNIPRLPAVLLLITPVCMCGYRNGNNKRLERAPPH